MGSFSLWHWAIILIVVLLLFGGRLPMLARSLGQSLVEFKKGMKELENHSDDEKLR
jgi:sec-independent protein translocase protein TatA